MESVAFLFCVLFIIALIGAVVIQKIMTQRHFKWRPPKMGPKGPAGDSGASDD